MEQDMLTAKAAKEDGSMGSDAVAIVVGKWM